MMLRNHKTLQKSFEHLIDNDPHFKKHFTRADLETLTREHGDVSYASLARTIVGQQISTKAAASVWARVQALCTPFSPQGILALDDATLRSAGLSGNKVVYLRGLSQAVHDKSFVPEALHAMSDAEVIAAVTALKGFGRWSAEMLLIFSLARPDVFSGGDLGLREGVRRVLKMEERPTEKQSILLAERWAPHRTAASLLLWHAIHKDGGSSAVSKKTKLPEKLKAAVKLKKAAVKTKAAPRAKALKTAKKRS